MESSWTPPSSSVNGSPVPASCSPGRVLVGADEEGGHLAPRHDPVRVRSDWRPRRRRCQPQPGRRCRPRRVLPSSSVKRSRPAGRSAPAARIDRAMKAAICPRVTSPVGSKRVAVTPCATSHQAMQAMAGAWTPSATSAKPAAGTRSAGQAVVGRPDVPLAGVRAQDGDHGVVAHGPAPGDARVGAGDGRPGALGDGHAVAEDHGAGGVEARVEAELEDQRVRGRAGRCRDGDLVVEPRPP